MAQSENKNRKLELVNQLESHRDNVDSARNGLSRELSVSRQLKKSVQSHPIPWFAGAFGTAVIAALILRRPQASGVVKKSKVGMLLGLGFALAKPSITKWAADRLKEEAGRRLLPQNRNSMLGEPR
ncbi:hypothetical protein N9Z02_00980 [Akkermansiaceae bacterium]|nr:hypothetical protein [Akkermansiaceae bacterium]